MQKQNGVADGEWFNFCLYVVMHLLCSLTVCLACLIHSLAVTFKGQFIKIAPRHILPVLSTQLIAPSRMQGGTPCREEFLCNALFFLLYVNASAVQAVSFEQEIALIIRNLLPYVTRFCSVCVPGELLIYHLIYFRKPDSHS